MNLLSAFCPDRTGSRDLRLGFMGSWLWFGRSPGGQLYFIVRLGPRRV